MMNTNRTGIQFSYASGIAPLVSAKEYAELITNYKATGQFPHILKIAGMAIDDSQNRNKWRIPKEDLDDIAAQLQDKPIMKNHDIDNVDAIIGRVNSAWRNENKVMYEGEISDESLIQKILLGYVKFNSIQIAIPAAFCDNCITKLGKKQEEAGIANLEEPCPRCGSFDMLIRKPEVLEQSMVAIPAYVHAEVQPLSFKASVDRAFSKRFQTKVAPAPVKVVKKAEPDPLPLLLAAYRATAAVAIGTLEIGVRMAKMKLEEAEEEVKPMNSWVWDYVKDAGDDFVECQMEGCDGLWHNPTQEKILQHFADRHADEQPAGEPSTLEKVGDAIGFLTLDEEGKYSSGNIPTSDGPAWTKDEHKVLGHKGPYQYCQICNPNEEGRLYEEGGSGVDEYVGYSCPDCKIGKMKKYVIDGIPGVECDNCGWGGYKSKEEEAGLPGEAQWTQNEHRVMKHGGRYAECPTCFPTRDRESKLYREEEERGLTVADAPTDAVLVTDSQDVAWVKDTVGEAANEYDGFFVVLGDGDITEVYGFTGNTAYNDKPLTKIYGEPDFEGNPDYDKGPDAGVDFSHKLPEEVDPALKNFPLVPAKGKKE